MGPNPTDNPSATNQETVRSSALIDRLLGDQLRRLRGRFLLHGMGAVIALPAVAILLFFLLDRSLRLPAPIRVFHTLLVLALGIGTALWFVRRPLRHALGGVDLAVLLERVFPELHQRLVSAVQLKGQLEKGDLRNQSAAMIELVLADAAATSTRLPLERLLNARATVRLWSGAAGAMLILLTGVLVAPGTAWAFVQRHLGLDVAYPRATRLIVELPPDGADIQRREVPGGIELTLAGGGDLHVSVLAEGSVPTEVFLEVTGRSGDRRSVGMTPRPGGRFRHVFRRVQGSFLFHARGGDDDTGDMTVEVVTILPPLVAEIEARLSPPAYTGKAPSEQRGGAIEGLIGTQVELDVIATAPASSAELVLLESGRRLELQPAVVQDDSGKAQVLRAHFVIEASDRYQIELVGDRGLRSPNPGTYPIVALQDYAPLGRWLEPGDEYGLMLLPEAALALRLDLQDDYGLTAAVLAVETSGGIRSIPLLPEPGAETAPPQGPPPTRLLPVELFEVRDLLGERRSGIEGLALSVELRDNREPEANTTSLPRRQVQIVDRAQLAAAISRNFRAVREAVGQALDVQRDRRERLAELQSQLGSTSPVALATTLTSVEVGQGRVQNTCERIHRQLMGAFDLHLWNRLESATPAAEVLLLYRDWHRRQTEARPAAPGFYREVAARRGAGTLGAMETTLDPILAMVIKADALQGTLLPQALRLLAEAQVARATADLESSIAEIVQVQTTVQKHLEELLGRLDEWNDFQDLIQETRALRDRQREVQGRTEEMRGK